LAKVVWNLITPVEDFHIDYALDLYYVLHWIMEQHTWKTIQLLWGIRL